VQIGQKSPSGVHAAVLDEAVGCAVLELDTFDQENYLNIRRLDAASIQFDFLSVPLLHLYFDCSASFHGNLSF